MISTKTSKTTIGPVLNFISYNMDLEWEAVNMDAQVKLMHGNVREKKDFYHLRRYALYYYS